MGEEINNVIPLSELEIVGDGNCLFRALSTILTGSQESFSKIRAEICRFIAVQGSSFISRYLKTKFEDVAPIQYLKKSNMDTDAIWGSDVEIIAFSKMLDVDIFVANLHNDVKKNECHWTWYRYSSQYHKYSNPAIYLTNSSNHFEPVIDLIHSRYPSFNNFFTFSDTIVLE